MNTLLSVLIVTFNNEDDLPRCLDSLCQYLEVQRAEIVVVDNASTDRTAAILREYREPCSAQGVRLRVVQNPANFGFTRAVNQGLQLSTGRFVLLLNPDTEVPPGSVRRLLQYLSNRPEVGAVAPQLRYPDGTVQPSCRRFPRYAYLLSEIFGLNRLFPRSRRFNAWKMGDFDHRSIRPVDQPQGACLMVKRSVLNEIGPLDERFFLFFSDVDLCKRIWDAGQSVHFYPQAKVLHRKGSAVYRDRARLIWQSHQDFIRYFLKWYRRPTERLANLFGIPFLAVLGIARTAVAWMRERVARNPSGAN